MKRITLFLFLAILLSSCKKEPKAEAEIQESPVQNAIIYPDNISKIFEAHGGIDLWNTMEGLNYEIEKSTINEKHSVALKSRNSIIEAEHHKLGFDGESVWLKELDTVKFKGNPKFYYNLYFYFYAMPFVLGDDGINYADAPPLHYEGKDYPGINISYNAGIGESPDDEYILYYNPETFKMEWLGYTVTFFSKEKSKEFRLIKYSDWAEVNGLQLPKTLHWYDFKDGAVGEMRNEMNFINMSLSNERPDDSIFKVQKGATITE